jgi:hypothetical protein
VPGNESDPDRNDVGEYVGYGTLPVASFDSTNGMADAYTGGLIVIAY